MVSSLIAIASFLAGVMGFGSLIWFLERRHPKEEPETPVPAANPNSALSPDPWDLPSSLELPHSSNESPSQPTSQDAPFEPEPIPDPWLSD